MEKIKNFPTIEFDPYGDLKLVVYNYDGPSVLVVSSKAMSLACDPWRVMLGPEAKFSEAQPEHSKIIPLPEDDPVALSILLHIVHLQFDQVPSKLEFDDFVEMAMLTDKYQATKLVAPWVPNWIWEVSCLAKREGFEKWLWIAWEFGVTMSFETVASRLVLESSTNDEGKCLTSVGEVVVEDMPSDIVENVLEVRKATIDRLLEIAYYHVNHFTHPNTLFFCRASRNNQACDALFYGSLIKELQRCRLGPDRKEASEIFMSVKELAQKLKTLELFVYPSDTSVNGNHGECSWSRWISTRVDKVLREIPSAVTDSHRRHLSAQELKCKSKG
ncbi:MAG: hypothetical protein M1834_009443 [Cirrosporium novae-zelandiae]|nr:MAG: hypothetical protein M1834_009443 [Cirrosporium novae-zelandiae]